MTPTAEDFQAELERIFNEAKRSGVSYVDVRAGDLHTKVGGYPAANHRMPVCCSVLRRNMSAHDEVMDAPKSGQGASLVIRYRIPR